MRQTATALDLQNQHIERLKDSIESGNAEVIGHITNLSLTRTNSAKGPSPHQTSTSALDDDPDVLRCKSTERSKTHVYRMRLPSWLVDRVWEFEVHRSINGWTTQVYAVNVRPYDSCIFDVVRSGNVKAVRELLESGQLSLHDQAHNPHGPDRNLLEVSN
jgi:hypothetical protein